MSKRKAFIVDDNRASAEALAKILGVLDVESIICLEPREAIQRLAQVEPDLIILDVNLPGVGGLEAVRYIRRDPRIVDLPIIVVSSNGQTTEKTKALLAGANIFLPKPVSYEGLALAVEDALMEN